MKAASNNNVKNQTCHFSRKSIIVTAKYKRPLGLLKNDKEGRDKEREEEGGGGCWGVVLNQTRIDSLTEKYISSPPFLFLRVRRGCEWQIKGRDCIHVVRYQPPQTFASRHTYWTRHRHEEQAPPYPPSPPLSPGSSLLSGGTIHFFSLFFLRACWCESSSRREPVWCFIPWVLQLVGFFVPSPAVR